MNHLVTDQFFAPDFVFYSPGPPGDPPWFQLHFCRTVRLSPHHGRLTDLLKIACNQSTSIIQKQQILPIETTIPQGKRQAYYHCIIINLSVTDTTTSTISRPDNITSDSKRETYRRLKYQHRKGRPLPRWET